MRGWVMGAPASPIHSSKQNALRLRPYAGRGDRSRLASLNALSSLLITLLGCQLIVGRADDGRSAAELFARCTVRASDWSEAVAACERLRALDPSYPGLAEAQSTAYVNRGKDLLAKGGPLAEVVANFDKALAVVPDHVEAKQQRQLAATYQEGETALKAENWPIASERFEQVYVAAPDYLEGMGDRSVRARLYTARLRWGQALLAAGDYAEARRRCEQALAVVSDSEEAKACRASAVAALVTPVPTVTPQEAVATVKRYTVYIRTNIGAGSGILLGDDKVLTTYHVIERASRIWVRFADGRESAARLERGDRWRDLALLRLQSMFVDESTVLIRDARDLRSAERLFVVGYPLTNLIPTEDPTVTSGIFSKLQLVDGVWHVQTDSPMNSGNSGGPVIDEQGRLVGVARWRIPGWIAVGFNFAVASEEVKAFLEGVEASPPSPPQLPPPTVARSPVVPQPQLSGSPLALVRRGQPFQVELWAVNQGAPAQSGSITVSVLGEAEVRVVGSSIKKTSSSYAEVFWPGQLMYHFGERTNRPIRTPVVEAYTSDRWDTGQEHWVRFEIVPRGPLSIQARATLRQGERFFHDPASGPTDQQGAPARTFSIAVSP